MITFTNGNRTFHPGFLSFIATLVLGVALLVTATVVGAVNIGHAPTTLAPCPAWSIAATDAPDGNSNNVLFAVSAASPTEAWAVGYSGSAQARKTFAMRWDGQAWKVVPSPNPGQITNYFTSVVAFSDKDVWATVSSGADDAPVPYILHWNGQSWNTATLPALDPAGNDLYAMSASSPTDIWAVGSVGCSNCKTERSLVLHYNGVDWQSQPLIVGAVADALFGVSASAPNNAWFVGYQFVDRGAQLLSMHWDGRALSKVETLKLGGPRNYFYSVAAFSPNDIWAVGVTINPGTMVSSPLLYHSNGSDWSKTDFPNTEGGITLLSVSGIAGNDVWAAGYYLDHLEEGQRHPLLLRYDGYRWSQAQFPDPGAGSVFNSVATTRSSISNVFAAGSRPNNGSFQPLVEQYADACAQSANPSPTAQPIAAPTMTAPVPIIQIPGANSRTFPETGKSVSGLFLDYWEKNGGLAQQGYPISAVLGEVSPLDGKPYTVQYFERAVFEYHPENQPPYNVLLSQLGTSLYKQKYPAGAPGQLANTTPGYQLFTETGKRVGGKFLAYWQQHGGLAQQGYPISDEFQEKSDLDGKTYAVQYFERSVFETHTENQPPYDILLSQLGAFRYKQKYEGAVTPSSTPGVPAPPSQPTSPPQTPVPTDPCANIPASDPGIEIQPGNCQRLGTTLTFVASGLPTGSANVAITDSEGKVIGVPIRVDVRGSGRSDPFIADTTEGFKPDLYTILFQSQRSPDKVIGYFRLIAP